MWYLILALILFKSLPRCSTRLLEKRKLHIWLALATILPDIRERIAILHPPVSNSKTKPLEQQWASISSFCGLLNNSCKSWYATKLFEHQFHYKMLQMGQYIQVRVASQQHFFSLTKAILSRTSFPFIPTESQTLKLIVSRKKNDQDLDTLKIFGEKVLNAIK